MEIKKNEVYHMDCMKGLIYLKSESVDLVFTDPPYNTGNSPTNKKSSTKLKSFFMDNLSQEDYNNLINNSFKECFRVLKNDSACLVFIDYRKLCFMIKTLKKIGFNFKQILIWDKVIHGLNYQNYAYQHEYILYFTKGLNHKPKRIKPKTDVIRCRRVNNDNKIDHETVKPLEQDN